MKKLKLKLISLALVSFSFAGCGSNGGGRAASVGGGGDGTGTSSPVNPPSTSTIRTQINYDLSSYDLENLNGQFIALSEADSNEKSVFYTGNNLEELGYSINNKGTSFNSGSFSIGKSNYFYQTASNGTVILKDDNNQTWNYLNNPFIAAKDNVTNSTYGIDTNGHFYKLNASNSFSQSVSNEIIPDEMIVNNGHVVLVSNDSESKKTISFYNVDGAGNLKVDPNFPARSGQYKIAYDYSSDCLYNLDSNNNLGGIDLNNSKVISNVLIDTKDSLSKPFALNGHVYMTSNEGEIFEFENVNNVLTQIKIISQPTTREKEAHEKFNTKLTTLDVQNSTLYLFSSKQDAQATPSQTYYEYTVPLSALN